MEKENISKYIYNFIVLPLLLLFLTACTSAGPGQKASDADKETSAEEEVQEGTQAADPYLEENGLFMITFMDSEEGTIRLYSYNTGKEYQYTFDLSTSFVDKYGNFASSDNFTPGRAVLAGRMDESGKLMKIMLSGDTWEYADVERYSINEENRVLTIAGSKYRWADDLFVFSEGRKIALEDIGESDEIKVVGTGRKILAVILTAGHGMLKLSNTDLFEGSFVQVGKKIFVPITKDMVMDVPEGEYTLSVANNGWGGTKDIRIKRGKETLVDLDSIKGEGPSYGKILFEVDADDAQIYIDNEKIDYSGPVSLTYGEHSISVTAPGYDTWSKILYVNSPEATISIGMEEEDTSASQSSESSSQNGSTQNGGQSSESSSQSSTQNGSQSSESSSQSSTQNGSQSSESSSQSSSQSGSSSSNSGSSGSKYSNSQLDDDDLSEYLSTLSNMLDSIF